MGRSQISNAEEAEMPDDNERASEQDELVSDGNTASGLHAQSYDEEPSSSANEPVEPSHPGSGSGPVPAPVPGPGPVQQPEPEVVKPKRSSRKASGRSRSGIEPNNVRKLRQEAMMSKAELARRAGVSPLTIDRVEAGCPCRMDTKRKILEALGLKPSARTEVWPDIDAQS